MPYDEALDQHIRSVIDPWPHMVVKKIFGGVCYLINGNIVAGVHQDKLILRLGEKNAREAIKKEHVGPFDVTGRPMRGWVMVAPAGFAKQSQMNQWLNLSRRFVNTLPAK